jgi:hypothetical protein
MEGFLINYQKCNNYLLVDLNMFPDSRNYREALLTPQRGGRVSNTPDRPFKRHRVGSSPIPEQNETVSTIFAGNCSWITKGERRSREELSKTILRWW